MNLLTNVKKPRWVIGIRGRLYIGFGMLALILVLATSFVLKKVSLTENIATEAIEVDMAAYNSALNLTLQISQAQSGLRAWLLTQDPQYKKRIFRSME